jgi:hypothetical protein
MAWPRLFYIRSIVWGGLLGIYYGEKKLPFPIQYIPKEKGVGDIKLDLSIVNAVATDISKLLPSPSK